LIEVLRKYDPTKPWYIGNLSEVIAALSYHGRFGYGGAGVVLSRAVMEVISDTAIISACLARYASLYGGDGRLGFCLQDIGVPLTRELGFHQVDFGGDLSGLLEGVFSEHPIVSLHHLEMITPILQHHGNPRRSFQRFFNSYHTLPASSFLSRIVTFDTDHELTIVLIAGYSLKIYPGNIPLSRFQRTEHTFSNRFAPPPFDFDTRPPDDPSSLIEFEYHSSTPLESNSVSVNSSLFHPFSYDFLRLNPALRPLFSGSSGNDVAAINYISLVRDDSLYHQEDCASKVILLGIEGNVMNVRWVHCPRSATPSLITGPLLGGK